MKPLQISENDRILILSPHPDDESIGCGGLLSLYGSQCDVVVMTDGSRGDINIPQSEMKRIRREEFLKAISHVAVRNYRLLDYPDGELILHPDCMKEINIGSYRKVFIPHYSEAHADHKATVQFFANEVKNIGTGCGDIETYQYETRAAIDDDLFLLDISSCIDNKLEMVGAYKSQLAGYDYVRFSKELAAYHAAKENTKAAFLETYSRYNPDKDPVEGHEGRMLTEYRTKNDVIDLWLRTHIDGKTISEYIRERYETIAIYGYGYFGRLLYKDITNNGAKVQFVIDRNADALKEGNITFVRPEAVRDVDLLIVSNLFGSESIKKDMLRLGFKDVVTLKDILLCLIEQEK